MYYIGIDIGSTAAKVAVFNEDKLQYNFTIPTGWSSLEVSKTIMERLGEMNVDLASSKVAATGYGRVSVPYAQKTITEITCHGKGSHHLLGRDATVIDIGGQDTKVITVKDGRVTNFTMNDKCAAGTGRFLDLMANSLGIGLDEMADMAVEGNSINISSMCTVFAESEVISLIGEGTPRKDIARGIINSITGRVSSMVYKHGVGDTVYLSGGLCEVESFVNLLSKRLGKELVTEPLARYAGAIGAALLMR